MDALHHPQDDFRESFYDHLVSTSPHSILDVGCGGGALVDRLRRDGIEAKGVDVNAEKIGDLGGLQVAVAESLPFEDNAFDWVVAQFSPHHWSDLRAALIEGLRVSKRGWMILDQWHDPQIAQQRLADRFDRWRKQLDRSRGMVHFPSFSTEDYVQAFDGLGVDLELQSLYQHRCRPTAMIDELIARSIDGSELEKPAQRELDEIREEIAKVGLTFNGALMITAERVVV